MHKVNCCPICGSKDVTVEKDLGCAFGIFTFISMGLGLLMIPFLPQYINCRVCGSKTKA